MRSRLDVTLLILFLLSLLTIVGAGFWDSYQLTLSESQFLSEWEDGANGFSQQFRANFESEVQLKASFLRSYHFLGKLSDPFSQNGERVKQAVMSNLPNDWIPSDSLFYVIKFSESGGRTLSGKGLVKLNGGFLARLFFGINDWDRKGIDERKKINSRLENIFGERLSAEILLDNRMGKGVDVVFQGECKTLYWDFLNFSGKNQGAFLIFSKNRLSHEKSARFTLSEIFKASENKIFPIMMPIESLKIELKPIILPENLGESSLLHLFSAISEKGRYSGVASLSVAILLDKVVLFRSAITRKIPFELWLVSARPDRNSLKSQTIFFVIFLISWLVILVFRFQRGTPFDFSVKEKLLGLILIVGGLPLLLLILAGKTVIEQDHHSRYRSLINEARSELVEIDGNSTSLRIAFENECRRLISDPGFRADAVNPEVDSVLFNSYFSGFKAVGVPMEGIGIFNFGQPDRMVFSPNAGGSGYDSILAFFSPLIYSGLQHFSMGDYKRAISTLSESQKLGIQTHQMITGRIVPDTVALSRQKSILLEFGDEGNYFFYDYIACQKEISTAVLFMAKTSLAYAQFARKAIVRGGKSSPDQLWGMVEKRGNGFKVVLPRERPTGEVEEWFLQRLSDSYHSSSTRVAVFKKTLAVCFPCEHMKGVVLGSTHSLEPLFAKTSYQYRLLIFASSALFLLLLMVASGIVTFFLHPLSVIENGMGRILDRRFDFRLNMMRDDELGDAANAFDQMAQGMCERNELAQFVSGSLSNNIEQDREILQTPETKWGVILASDIRSFTTLSEIYPPEEIVEMLNRHLELMSNCITRRNGEIDKFIGDAIIAVFFAENHREAAKNAIEAAREMMSEHREFVAKRSESGQFGYGMGIGIACGELVIGSFGSGTRHEYSLIGKARHQSEKLEAESKSGRFSHIVISPEIRHILPELRLVQMQDGENYEVVDS